MVVLKLICSLLITLLIPGYLLSYVLFPDQTKLDRIERFVIALLSGLAISSLMGVALLKLDFDLNITNILISLTIITFIFLFLILFRIKTKYRAMKDKNKHIMLSRTKVNLLWILLAFTLIVSLGFAYWIIPPQSIGLTEFYISPDWFNHKFNRNPGEMEITEVPVMIHNLEGEETVYEIETSLDDIQIWESEVLIIEDNATNDSIIPIPDYDTTIPHLLTIKLKNISEGNYVSTLRLHIDQHENSSIN